MRALNTPRYRQIVTMLNRATNKLKRALRSTSLYRALNPRKMHLYCVGTAKSGTHSIEAIFRDHLRSAHEADSDKVMQMILALSAGRIDGEQLRRYVLKRDRRLWLEIDSSQLNFFLLDVLVDVAPQARFLLTIRNPYAWLDSFINHQLSRDSSDTWDRLRDLRFRPDTYTHSLEERALKEKGLYTLDGYLSYWARHNQTVIDTVPAERLLVVRTDRISHSVPEIAAFAGVSGHELSREKSHACKAGARFNMLDSVGREFLESRVKAHCGDLMARFFPEIRSRQDAAARSRVD